MHLTLTMPVQIQTTNFPYYKYHYNWSNMSQTDAIFLQKIRFYLWEIYKLITIQNFKFSGHQYYLNFPTKIPIITVFGKVYQHAADHHYCDI